jgi:tripartite-type tricarboxylate transporter receptor subunit TctC
MPVAGQSPNTPLRILVAVPAGGTSDVVARVLAEAVRTDIARPIVVDNRPGATGLIAVEALRSATPDGSTVFLAPIAVPVVVPLVFKNANFDPTRDLVPISQVAKFEWALAVADGHHARTLNEFIAWAKAHRERATYGTGGVASVPHLLGMLLAREADVELLHVPYKGASAVEADLRGGQIAAAFGAISDLVPAHRAGKLRILATTGVERSLLLPEIPTFRQQGFASMDAIGWLGVFAPAKTPQPMIDRLSSTFARATRAPEVRERLLALGLQPSGTTAGELATAMAADTARWRAIVNRIGFTVE